MLSTVHLHNKEGGEKEENPPFCSLCCQTKATAVPRTPRYKFPLEVWGMIQVFKLFENFHG